MERRGNLVQIRPHTSWDRHPPRLRLAVAMTWKRVVPRKDASFLRHCEEAESRRGNLVPQLRLATEDLNHIKATIDVQCLPSNISSFR
jgi:hypothetical protein